MLCAPNAFKGTLTAEEAAIAMALGADDAGWEAVAMPVADGGDGTLDVLLAAAGEAAAITHHEVTGPLGARVRARLGWLGDGTAVVELAEACGLRLLRPEQRDALRASSRGCGDLIAAALDGGAAEIVVGVGGSASSDGGAGLLQALGAVLRGPDGGGIASGGAALAELRQIDLRGLRPGLDRVRVACDVRNPLLGEAGAATVFGPQKGASPEQVAVLERGLRRFAEVASRDAEAPSPTEPRTGAAGGAAYGLRLAGARLEDGAPLVCAKAGLTVELLSAFDLVLTGEGRLDAQTAYGKAPAHVAAIARAAGVPAIAVAGQVVDPLPALFATAVSLRPGGGGDAEERLRAATRQALDERRAAAADVPRRQ